MKLLPYMILGAVMAVGLIVMPSVRAESDVRSALRVVDDHGATLLECNETLSACKGPLLEQLACYQRMQEAMTVIGPYLLKSTEVVSRDAMYQRTAEMMSREDAAVELFRIVAKECIQ